MRWLVSFALSAALVTPAVAFAQSPKAEAKKEGTPAAAKGPGSDHPHDEKGEAHHDKDAKDAKKDGGKDDDAHGRHDGGMPDDVRAKLAEMRQKHAATRAERRKEEREKAKAKWGAALNDAPVRAEMATHARREARIDAMEEAAKAGNKDALLAKIKELRAKEDARHDKKMEQLAKRADGGVK